MNEIKLRAHQLDEWLKDEKNQGIILHRPLAEALNVICKDIDFLAALIMFNVKVDLLGLNKVIELVTDEFPSYCLLSTRMPKTLTIKGLKSTLYMLKTSGLATSTLDKNSLRELNVGVLLAQPSHFLFDALNIEKMTIDMCNSQVDLATCVNEVKELVVKNFKSQDTNLQYFAITDDSRLNVIHLPETISFIYAAVFKNANNPLKIVLKNTSEVSFQKGAFNHNIDHTILIPNGTRVKCHNEDKEYLRSHIQRY